MNPPVDPPMPVFDMGLRLYRTFIDGGLDAPELRQDTPIGGGVDWPGYALIAESVRSLLPFMEQIGTVTADGGRRRHARSASALRGPRTRRRAGAADGDRRVGEEALTRVLPAPQ